MCGRIAVHECKTLSGKVIERRQVRLRIRASHGSVTSWQDDTRDFSAHRLFLQGILISRRSNIRG